MKYFTIIILYIGNILLNGCAVTSKVIENAEGKYLSYTTYNLKNAAYSDKNSILL